MNAKKRTQAELDYLGAIKRIRARRTALSQEFGHTWEFLARTAYRVDLDYLEVVDDLRLACLPLSLVSILLGLSEAKEFSSDLGPSHAWSRLVDRIVRLRKQALGAALSRRIAIARNMKNQGAAPKDKGGKL